MIYAGILAGGRGTRMGRTERPKQFLQLADGTPIVIRTLRAFLAVGEISQVVVASEPSWADYLRSLVDESFVPEVSVRVHVIDGGAARSDSLANICAHIERTWGLDDDDILVSHDAVRPFVTERIIRDNIEGARAHGCVDTVVPATDTIVVSNSGEHANGIPDRSRFYQGQTPQSFFIREYQEAFASLSSGQKGALTDACMVYMFCGKPVYLVRGEYSNIKITTRHDIHVATSIMEDERGDVSI